ncbi:hypothetical protein [Raoultella planticola]|uniref:hypothetical protein n=1 Tax=Raoultella planticola TaxID=575 RepID=UPI001F53C3BD|nr:hypothetical protein [Raoultella planticola]MDV1192124.1 hypothetical protein [Raoultella planticola]UNK76088.1 hypothetical protein MNO12_05860 [Raoultella planticola]
MNSTAARTFTEHLERTIEQGVELRDAMRKQIESLKRVVSEQKREINDAILAKELYRRRLSNYKNRLVAEREKRQKLEGKIIKLKRRIGDA